LQEQAKRLSSLRILYIHKYLCYFRVNCNFGFLYANLFGLITAWVHIIKYMDHFQLKVRRSLWTCLPLLRANVIRDRGTLPWS